MPNEINYLTLALDLMSGITGGINKVKALEATFTPEMDTADRDIAIAEALFPDAIALAKKIKADLKP